MKPTLLFLFVFSNLSIYAQNILKFDKRNTQCENKWVVFPMSKDSTYVLGFIYIDEQAGLTLNYESKFKINKDGSFLKIDDESKKNSSIKYRLEPNKMLLALIPDTKLKELNFPAEPDWLKIYKHDEDSIERLYRWGYLYNEYGEYDLALEFLEKGFLINPEFKGLLTELAFSYNALNKFDKAEKVLLLAVKNNPKDCYTLKELAYTYKNIKNFDKSIETYKKMTQICDNKVFIQESAYNLAYEFYVLKDKKNFKKWNVEARKWSDKANRYTNALDAMEKEFNQ